jgi:hypothetical protein
VPVPEAALKGTLRNSISSPVTGPNLVILSNGYTSAQPIFAIRPGSSGDITPGIAQAQTEFVAWRINRNGQLMPTPIVYQGRPHV